MTPNENPGCSSSSVGVCTSVLSKTNEWRKDFRKGKKKYSYCTICSEFPEICRQFAYRDGIPSIVHQSRIVIQHHKSNIHSACVDAKQKKELFQQEVRQKAIKCLYDVYNDAKRCEHMNIASIANESCTRVDTTRLIIIIITQLSTTIAQVNTRLDAFLQITKDEFHIHDFLRRSSTQLNKLEV